MMGRLKDRGKESVSGRADMNEQLITSFLSIAVADMDFGGGGGKKRKRSRWGDSEVDKAFIPGMPTVLPSNMNKEQEELYLRK